MRKKCRRVNEVVVIGVSGLACGASRLTLARGLKKGWRGVGGESDVSSGRRGGRVLSGGRWVRLVLCKLVMVVLYR